MSKVTGNPNGCPPTFTSSVEVQGLIDNYFIECDGKLLEDKDGIPILNKYDEPIVIGAKPYTVTGLALALGFNSRQTLLNYQAKDEFMDTIVRAKAYIEQYAERRLYDREGSNGAKFVLANNYGWRDKTEVESTNLNYNKDMTTLSDEEIEIELNKLK